MKIKTAEKLGKKFRIYANKFEAGTLTDKEKEEFIRIVARVGNTLHATVIDLAVHRDYLKSKSLSEEFIQYRRATINQLHPINQIYSFNKQFKY